MNRFRGVTDKEVRRLLVGAERAGCQIRLSGSNHWIVRTGSGEFVTTVGSTPSSQRSARNIAAAFARHGVQV